MKRSLTSVALLCVIAGCGADGVGRLALDVELPVVVSLTDDAMEAPTHPERIRVAVSERVDLVASLRARGLGPEAEALAAGERIIESLELLAVEYEVPHAFAGDVAPIELALAPADRPEAARPLGATVAVPSGQRIAARRLELPAEGAGLLDALDFVVVAATAIDLQPATPPGRLELRLRLVLRVHTDWL